MTTATHEYTEPVKDPPYEGTIIDVETNHHYHPICVGTLHDHTLSILYLTNDDPATWTAHADAIEHKLTSLPRPYLAFRATFDQNVLSTFLDRSILFDGDLHVLPHSKDTTARKLGAPLIPDPLKGRSREVPDLWDKYLRRKRAFLLDRIIKHNRACLLKETYIAQNVGWTPISNYALTHDRIITMNPHDDTTQLLLNALKTQTLVDATYRDRKGEETTRQLAILSLGHQYVTAYCYLRHQLRTFKISRLFHLKRTRNHIENAHEFW